MDNASALAEMLNKADTFLFVMQKCTRIKDRNIHSASPSAGAAGGSSAAGGGASAAGGGPSGGGPAGGGGASPSRGGGCSPSPPSPEELQQFFLQKAKDLGLG